MADDLTQNHFADDEIIEREEDIFSDEQPAQQAVTVGGPESTARVEVQKSAETEKNQELPPAVQKILADARKHQQEARAYQQQGDLQQAVQAEEEILQEFAQLANPETGIQTSRLTQTSEMKQERQTQKPVTQQSKPTAQSKEAEKSVSPPESMPHEVTLTDKGTHTVEVVQKETELPQPEPAEDIPTAPAELESAPTESKPEEIVDEKSESGSTTQPELEDVSVPESGKTEEQNIEIPIAVDSIVSASEEEAEDLQIKDIKTVADSPVNASVSGKPPAPAPIASLAHATTHQATGTRPLGHKEEQHPLPAPEAGPITPEQLASVETAEEPGRKASIELLEAVIEKLAATPDSSMDKLAVQDSEEALFRMIQKDALNLILQRVREGEWEPEKNLASLATKLGIFSVVGLFRELKKKTQDQNVQQKIQMAINYLLNENDILDIQESQSQNQPAAADTFDDNTSQSGQQASASNPASQSGSDVTAPIPSVPPSNVSNNA